MPLAIPLAAIGVALLMLLVAYAATVLLTPILEAVLRRIPLIGSRLATWAVEGVDYAYTKIHAWVLAGVHGMEGWLRSLAERVGGLAEALAALADSVYDALDHLVTVTIPREIRAAVRDVHDLADRAYNTAHNAEVAVSRLDDAVDVRVRDARHAVEAELQRGIDTVEHDLTRAYEAAIARGIDRLRTDLQAELHGIEGDLTGGLAGVRDLIGERLRGVEAEVGADVGTIEDEIGRLGVPALAQHIAELTAGLAVVEAIAQDAGLGRAECRAKVRGVCSTDPDLWGALLGGLAAVEFGLSLREIVEAGNALVSTVGGDLVEAVT